VLNDKGRSNPAFVVSGRHIVSMVLTRRSWYSLGQLTTSESSSMRLVFLAAAALSLAACATTSPEHGSRSRLLYIAGTKAPCTNGVMRTECLQYREQPNEPWKLNYAPVEGLDWKAGNEYLLKITEVHAKSSPQDASGVTWHVDKIVEQHPSAESPLK
jgi:hypothetical protein